MSRSKRSRSVVALSVLVMVIATLVIGIGLLIWMQQSSDSHVFERTRAFHDLMRVIRPILLVLILLLWRPAFDFLNRRSFITDTVHERALLFWPRLAIWTALIEITLGQGYILIGLATMAAYWLFLRLR